MKYYVYSTYIQTSLIPLDSGPRDGEHHCRLAVDQANGYMVHNAVVYGLITTVNAFAFMARANGGILKLARLLPATTTNPTVLQMLYCMSHLCATTPIPLRDIPRRPPCQYLQSSVGLFNDSKSVCLALCVNIIFVDFETKPLLHLPLLVSPFPT